MSQTPADPAAQSFFSHAKKRKRAVMSTKPDLRLVKPDETAPPKSLAERVASADRRTSLTAQIEQFAEDFASKSTKPYERAQIARQLRELRADLEALDAAEGEGDIGSAAATPDEVFDAEAL